MEPPKKMEGGFGSDDFPDFNLDDFLVMWIFWGAAAKAQQAES